MSGPTAAATRPARLPRRDALPHPRRTVAPASDLLLLVGAIAVVVDAVVAATTAGPPPWAAPLRTAAPMLLARGGFLIQRPLAEAAATGTAALRADRRFRARALRLLPLWWVVLVAHLVIIRPVDPEPLHLATLAVLGQAVVPDADALIRSPAVIVSALWLFGIVASPWNSGVRRLRRRLRLRVPPGRCQAAGLLVLLAASAATPLRIFVPVVIGALAATVFADRRPAPVIQSLRRLLLRPLTAPVLTAVGWAALAVILAGRSGPVPPLGEDPARLLLGTLAAIGWILRTDRRGVRDHPRSDLVGFLARPAGLALGLILWHHLPLHLLLEHFDSHLRTPNAIHLTLVGGFGLAALSRFVLERPLRRSASRRPGPADDLLVEWATAADRSEPPRARDRDPE